MGGIDEGDAGGDVGAGLFAARGLGEPAGEAVDADAVGIGGQGDGGADRSRQEGVLVGDAGVAPGVVGAEQQLPLGRGDEAADLERASSQARAGFAFVAERLDRQEVAGERAEGDGHGRDIALLSSS